MQTRAIEIDFDVHKRIELERRSFTETHNAVLRRLLRIDDPSASTDHNGASVEPVGRPWSAKGATLPHGTRVRMQYNRKHYEGVIDDGQWLVDGARYYSPSAAAGSVARTRRGARTDINGWAYWEVLLPGASNWILLKQFRRA